MSLKSILPPALFLATVFVLWPLRLEASIEYSLRDLTGSIAGHVAPCARVTVTRTSNTTATIHFKCISSNRRSYSLGGARALALNINGTVASWSTGSGRFFQKARLAARPHKRGRFNFVLNSRRRLSEVMLHIVGSGTLWLSDGDVLRPNADGNVVAAHLFATGGAHSCTVPSGFAVASASAVPEPATAAIWTVGAIAASALFHRRRRGNGYGGPFTITAC